MDNNLKDISLNTTYNAVLEQLYNSFKTLQKIPHVSDDLVSQLRDMYANMSYYSICQVIKEEFNYNCLKIFKGRDSRVTFYNTIFKYQFLKSKNI